MSAAWHGVFACVYWGVDRWRQCANSAGYVAGWGGVGGGGVGGGRWRQRHWTLPFEGERFSVVWFTPKVRVSDEER